MQLFFENSGASLLYNSGAITNIVMVANTEQHITIPVGARRCKIQYSNHIQGQGYYPPNVYCVVDGAGALAHIPTVTTANTGIDFRPPGYQFRPDENTISDDSPIITINFFL